MRSLRLVALSDDGKNLILATEGADGAEGERFLLPVDDRVRAAARGDSRRLTQIDVDLGTELPPRVIQARIRAGETPEQVAAASGTRVERIMRFAHPVIQERERVAEQARDARVRLSEGAPGGILQQFMSDRLRLIDSDIEAVVWDAHRTEDGTWQVTGAWRAGEKSGLTRWTFDLPSRTVTPFDAATMDFAEGTRLVRVVPDVPAGAPVTAHRPRSVSVVRDAADDSVVHDTVTPEILPADLLGHDDGELVRDVHPANGSPADERSFEALLDEVADHDTVVLGPSAGTDGEDADPRARIPAWEDIVFGVRRHR
ncbi:MAG TPA: septation protein SepH [Blastococcus sp.]